jgi:hypothetical protein
MRPRVAVFIFLGCIGSEKESLADYALIHVRNEKTTKKIERNMAAAQRSGDRQGDQMSL